MSVISHTERPGIGVRPVWTGGAGLLAVSKFGDLLTTVIGLVYVDGITERNPVAAAVFEAAGVPGLVAVSLGGVALVIVVVEGLTSYLRCREDVDLDPRVPYLLSYVPLVGIFTLVTVHNTLLVLAVH